MRRARRKRWAFLLLAAFLLTMSFGCANSSREEREEFARISRAIDGLRNAENAHKAQMIQPLRAAACHHYCELRDQCVGAYEVHIRALDAIERARLRLTLGASELGPANIDAGDLDAAELMLEKAKLLATECAAKQAELGR